MRPEIHPKYYPNAKVVCGCGNVFYVGSTQPELRIDICARCHPFFTGEQRIVDTAGQVERFMRRLERREEIKAAPQQPAPAKAKRAPQAKTDKTVSNMTKAPQPVLPQETPTTSE